MRAQTSEADDRSWNEHTPIDPRPYPGALSTHHIKPATIASVAVWLASTVSGPAATELIMGSRSMGNHGPEAAVMLSTSLLTILIAYRAPRASSDQRATAWCIVGGMVFGALNAGLSLALWDFACADGSGNPLELFALGTVFGSVMGSPLGFGFGLAFLLPVHMSRSNDKLHSHTAGERTLMQAGGWLVMVCLLGAASQAWVRDQFALPFLVSGALAGVVAFAVGMARARHRATWLARAEVGSAPGWVVRAQGEDDEVTGLKSFVAAPAHRCRRVLAYRVPATQNPYRHRERDVPVARC